MLSHLLFCACFCPNLFKVIFAAQPAVMNPLIHPSAYEALEKRLSELEPESLKLEPDAQTRLETREQVIRYSEEFLESNPTLKAFVIDPGQGKAILDHPIGENPVNMSSLLDILKTQVDTPGLNPASHGHLGYIPGGGLFYSALGDYLADISNRYAGLFFASPGAVRMENMLVRWMCDITGYSQAAHGTLTSGGSIANLVGIVTARDAKKLKARDFEKTVIYSSSQVHHSSDKAIRIAGLGEAIIRHIALDERSRILPGLLKEQIIRDEQAGLKPFLIIASMGTTNTGAIDPIDEIADIAESHNLWLHVDAAYGGFFMLCEEVRERVKGLHRADSIVMDPHKGLFIPYGLGAVLIKDGTHLTNSQHYTASYMQDAQNAVGEISPAEASPELTRHFRALRLWLPLLLHGLKPFKAALEEKLLLARYFETRIREIPGFEIVSHTELSVVGFRYLPASIDPELFNKRLVEEIHKDGRVFLSSTTINGSFAIRCAVLSFRTHRATIDLSLEILKEKAGKILEELS